MPTTLLAVDDSVTMRRVLEMTFAGEDFRVITADGPDAALARIRAERPTVVLADVSLDGTNGYGLCTKIKADFPAIGVILLASKQTPYDSQKGAAARADDFIEKPFDTQQLIDKVKRVLSRPAEVSRAPVAPAAVPAEVSSTRSTAPFGARPAPAPAPVNARPQPAPVAPPPPVVDQRPVGRGTLAYSSPPGTKPAASMPASPPASGIASRAPAPAPLAAAPAVAAAPVANAVAGVVNGALGSQLSEMGLTEAQVQGVLALSREIVERVVWEVVPVLAETIIKEEIQRLTRE